MGMEQPHPSLAPLSHALVEAVETLMGQAEQVEAEQAPIRQRQEVEQSTLVPVGEEQAQEPQAQEVQEL